jgi:hypothetical protein
MMIGRPALRPRRLGKRNGCGPAIVPGLAPARLRRLGLTSVCLGVGVAFLFASEGCKKKVTQAQCDELLNRYATLVVSEKLKDAPPEQLKAEQQRERDEARNDDDFKNCTTELSTEDYACAMKATTADAVEKCLE